MSGLTGPTLTDQTPFASFVIGCGLPSVSSVTVTCVAFGAAYRKVIVRSAPTSGDTIAGPRPPRPPAAWPAGACADGTVDEIARTAATAMAGRIMEGSS